MDAPKNEAFGYAADACAEACLRVPHSTKPTVWRALTSIQPMKHSRASTASFLAVRVKEIFDAGCAGIGCAVTMLSRVFFFLDK